MYKGLFVTPIAFVQRALDRPSNFVMPFKQGVQYILSLPIRKVLCIFIFLPLYEMLTG